MTRRSRRLVPVLTCITLAGLGSLASGAAHAIGCDELRTSIADKMQRGGLPRPQILILDAAERSTGRVVGTCDNGGRKLVLGSVAAGQGQEEAARLPVQQAAAATAPSRPARKPSRDEDVLVECFDGKQYTDGPCKR